MSKKSLTTIISDTAKAFEVKVADIRSSERSTARAALARQVAMYVHMTHTRGLQSATATAFKRDPSTVTYARKKIEKEMKRDPKFRAQVNQLCA